MNYIYVDQRDRDLGGYVADAQKAVASEVQFPPGYYATWSGQLEYPERPASLADRPLDFLSAWLMKSDNE